VKSEISQRFLTTDLPVMYECCLVPYSKVIVLIVGVLSNNYHSLRLVDKFDKTAVFFQVNFISNILRAAIANEKKTF
jgi:hypothetical protein